TSCDVVARAGAYGWSQSNLSLSRAEPPRQCVSLTASAEFERVRSEGRSWTSAMLLLRVARGPADQIRFGTVASKRLGKAVRRNRARRLIREAMRRLCDRMRTGWDLVIVVRSGVLGAKAGEVEAALEVLASGAGLIEGPPEDEVSAGGSSF